MKNPKISLIAAIGKNRELGKDNKLLWHIPADLQRFRQITSGHPVIMGRKTYQSIGKSLPNRTNIVITSNSLFRAPNCIIVSSLEEAVNKAKETEQKNMPAERQEIFIIGGGQIYNQAINEADKLYLTVIDAATEADTFFPDYSAFKKVIFEQEEKSEGYKYKFLDLER